MSKILHGLERVAAKQHGYITQRDVERLNTDSSAFRELVEDGVVEDISFGLYRMAACEWTSLTSYMEAVLWPHDRRGVLSHATALMLHNLSDVNPAKIDLCVETSYQPQQVIPRLYRLHYENLAAHEITEIDGIPIVTAEKAVLQSYQAALGPALIGQAIHDGYNNELFTKQTAIDLAQKVCLPASILKYYGP